MGKILLDKINSMTKNLSRIEVTDDVTGRLFVKYFVGSVKLNYQDDGRTLKVFIKIKK